MHRGAVQSNVVKLGLTPELRILLDDYIKNSLTIPIILFQTTTVEDAILLAVDYLREKKEGVVEIPASDTKSWVKIVSSRDSVGEVHINFITTMHRYPTVESRPYTSDPWKAGDIIINNDITSNKCIGWACMSDGTPGTWEQFGHVKKWYSQIEEVDSLPDPSELQANRVVINHSDDQLYNVYYCTKVSESSDWEWLKLRIFDAELPNILTQYFSSNTILQKELEKYFETHLIGDELTTYLDNYFETHSMVDIVAQYIDQRPITTEIDCVLLATDWVGDSAPYSQVITNADFAKAVSGIMNLAPGISNNLYDEAAQARMLISDQDNTSVTISAYGTKPSSDIPLKIMLINTNYSK